MEIGIDSFAAMLPDPATGRVPPADQRMGNLIDEIIAADRAGLDVFGVGEHHRAEFLDSAPAIILAAAASRTRSIRLTSAVTVLSAADPVRVFQEFATLDLISRGRAELVVGRGSFGEAYPIFGFRGEDYDDLFVEKLELLLKLRTETHPRWTGRFRPPLANVGIYPRPVQAELPVWIGVGGTPQSVVRAGTLGVPLMIAIIGGEFRRFRPLVDLYREAGRRAGHSAERLRVGVHAIGFVADTDAAARDTLFPGWTRLFTDIGRERGRPPATRAQFDAMCGPGGAFLIGTPDTVRAKIEAASDALGGIDRVTFQMSYAMLQPEAMLRSIALLGREVAASIRTSKRETVHG